jgi:hypothetical protein
VALPHAIGRTYPNANREWGWQWVFPPSSHYIDRETGIRRRHHLHESVIQRAMKDAVRKAVVAKPARLPCRRVAVLSGRITALTEISDRLNAITLSFRE